jgi:NhaP-type Na+/H+ or K+/H+ antiporter
VDATALAAVAGALLVWALLSSRLSRFDISGPMALVALGLVAHSAGLADLAPDGAPLGVVAQAALALLLFTDAARIDITRLRHDAQLPGRLLGVGLPLTLVVGAGLAYVIQPSLGWGAALLVAACLAPTDAGLGAAIVNDQSVPRRIRRTLNVESGLNDGIAAPVVTLAIAVTAQESLDATHELSSAAAQLGIGVVVGVAVGVVGGYLLRWATRREWVEQGATPLAVLALAVLANTTAIAAGGNGFIAAFVAGLAFGPALSAIRTRSESEAPLEFAEFGGQLLGSVVWFLFGAVLLVPILRELSWQIVVYALLSLTVVRMVPVAVSLIGMRLGRPTVIFLGWFGPRGLASLVFAIEAMDELGGIGDEVAVFVGFTVLLSVVAHGATSGPWATRYSGWCATRDDDHPTMAHMPVMTSRGTGWSLSAAPKSSSGGAPSRSA